MRPGLKFPVSQGHVPPNSLPRVIWITLVGTLATTHMGWLVAAAQSRPIQILLHPFTKPQQKLLRAPPLPCTCAPCLLPTGTGGRKLLEKHSGKNQLLLLPPPRTPLCFVSRTCLTSHQLGNRFRRLSNTSFSGLVFRLGRALSTCNPSQS